MRWLETPNTNTMTQRRFADVTIDSSKVSTDFGAPRHRRVLPAIPGHGHS